MSFQSDASDLALEAYFAFHRGELERSDLLTEAAIKRHRECLLAGVDVVPESFGETLFNIRSRS